VVDGADGCGAKALEPVCSLCGEDGGSGVLMLILLNLFFDSLNSFFLNSFEGFLHLPPHTLHKLASCYTSDGLYFQ
jgi:hypothetical protein